MIAPSGEMHSFDPSWFLSRCPDALYRRLAAQGKRNIDNKAFEAWERMTYGGVRLDGPFHRDWDHDTLGVGHGWFVFTRLRRTANGIQTLTPAQGAHIR